MLTFSKTAVLAVAAALAIPLSARAQDTGKGFLFGSPSGSVTFRGGWAGARAGSDLFAFTTENLTLDRGDFSSPELGMDLAVGVLSRTQLVFSVGLSGVDKHSEFRHFIDNNKQPIEQTTAFRRVPLTLSVKQYLTSPGRPVGRFAWIPSRAAAYVGAGGGSEYYRFKQSGDFIDFDTMDVFPDTYTSEGWARTAHVFAGGDYTLNPRFALTTEARYNWSSGRLQRDFAGFNKLDLSGLSTTVGLTIRY